MRTRTTLAAATRIAAGALFACLVITTAAQDRQPEPGAKADAPSGQVAPPKSAEDIADTPAGTVMTKEYVETVGRLAYLWGWPLVNHYNRAATFAKLP